MAVTSTFRLAKCHLAQYPGNVSDCDELSASTTEVVLERHAQNAIYLNWVGPLGRCLLEKSELDPPLQRKSAKDCVGDKILTCTAGPLRLQDFMETTFGT